MTEPAEAFCGELAQVGTLGAAQRVPDREGDAVLEPHVCADDVDEPVDPGGAVAVGSFETGQPQRGALDGDGGVLLGESDDGPAHRAGQGPGLAHGHGSRSSLPRCRRVVAAISSLPLEESSYAGSLSRSSSIA